MARALRMENYDVLLAADGSEALTHITNGAIPDLILTDMRMPGIDGAEFIRRLAAIQAPISPKVIVVSGIHNLDEESRRIGAHGFVRKPVDLDALYAEVRRHLPGQV